MADLKTQADAKNYRQVMLDGLRKHDWLAYNWIDGSDHERIAELLVSEGLIEEMDDPGGAGRRAFRLPR